MKKVLLIITLVAAITSSMAGQSNIAEARQMGAGATVTVTGIVTNGPELGPIRYFQDATAGIAAYATSLSEVKRGDEITVTGVLKDYNTLLEIDPVTSFTVNSSGNPSPVPVELTPSQFAEEYEGMLVKVHDVDFDASGTFERTSYTFTAGEESGQMYVNGYDSPLIGLVIPTNPITLVGPLGVYNDTYQVLPRDQFDLLSSSVINLTSIPSMSGLSTTGFNISWTTDVAGTTEAFYGNTASMELGKLSEAGTGTEHQVSLTGLTPSEVIYIQPFSVEASDTAKAPVQVYVTQSLSSGDMKAYFNRPVDHSVSLGLLEAKYLDHAIDDTLIKYIDRANESIDISIYNFNNYGISNISEALNNAYNRGVRIRIVYDSNIDAAGVSSLEAGIGRIASPKSEYPYYGIMHNKFVIIDANADDPDEPIVWTGATNFTDGQINTDPNNVIIIQDKSLALAFQLEFNEMFGSEGAQPNASKAKFGPDKADNTPHQFIIDGKRVELYFSPSDGTHTKILDAISTGDYSIDIATMLITKTDIGYDLVDKNDAGVDVKVLLNDYDDYGEPIVNTLKLSLEDDIRLTGEPGIMHHKYMIVDQGHADSDPLLLTGSHNWSTSAQFRNDENTLIIYDQAVANAYYQDFVARFAQGILVVPKPECKSDYVTMYGGSSFRYDVLYNDNLPGDVNIEITRQPSHGSAVVETDQTLTYTPDPGFNKAIDTVGYKVCLQSSPGICDSALFVIYVNKPVTSGVELFMEQVGIYPNPAEEMVVVSSTAEFPLTEVILKDMSGREIMRKSPDVSTRLTLSLDELKGGIYLLSIRSGGHLVTRRLIVR